jgi:hypothetical protein
VIRRRMGTQRVSNTELKWQSQDLTKACLTSAAPGSRRERLDHEESFRPKLSHLQTFSGMGHGQGFMSAYSAGDLPASLLRDVGK